MVTAGNYYLVLKLTDSYELFAVTIRAEAKVLFSSEKEYYIRCPKNKSLELISYKASQLFSSEQEAINLLNKLNNE